MMLIAWLEKEAWLKFYGISWKGVFTSVQEAFGLFLLLHICCSQELDL
jgi:hypothetical protein